MLRRRLGLALGASLVSGASALCVARTRPATVPLASTVCQPLLPTTVLVHGLDSSKETWCEAAHVPCHARAMHVPCTGHTYATNRSPHSSIASADRSGVLAELTSRGYPALALDLRGHGESPFGPPDDFGAETLARDVWDAVVAHGVYATEGSNPRAS